MQTKSSLSTTEFLVAVVSAFAGLWTTFSSEPVAVKCTAIASFGLVSCAYIWSRTKVKTETEAGA